MRLAIKNTFVILEIEKQGQYLVIESLGKHNPLLEINRVEKEIMKILVDLEKKDNIKIKYIHFKSRKSIVGFNREFKMIFYKKQSD